MLDYQNKYFYGIFKVCVHKLPSFLENKCLERKYFEGVRLFMFYFAVADENTTTSPFLHYIHLYNQIQGQGRGSTLGFKVTINRKRDQIKRNLIQDIEIPNSRV